MFLFFIYFSNFILSFFGNEFEDNTDLLIILSFGQLVNVISGPVGYALVASGELSRYSRYSILALVVNIVFNYVLIGLYGAIGAAYSTALSVIILNLLCIFLLHQKLKFISFGIWFDWFRIVGELKACLNLIKWFFNHKRNF